MKDVSERFLDSLVLPHKRVTTFTCTPPGGDPVELPWTSLSTSFTSSIGIRRTADATISPVPGVDLYGLCSTPGAIFHIEHGIDYGAGQTELVPTFHGEAASGGVSLVVGEVRLSLADMWQRLERCRFLAPVAPAAGPRAARLAAAITGAIPGAQVITSGDAGDMKAGTTWDRDRAQYVRDIATDGAVDVYPDTDGTWKIRPMPQMTPQSPSWVLRTGDFGNILSADRERPFDRLYNTVVVVPQDETQTWARVVLKLSNPDHPCHESKVGVVPFFWSSPTNVTRDQAAKAGRTILQRVTGLTETMTFDALGNPALEGSETVAVAHQATDTTLGVSGSYFVDGGSLDHATGSMSLQVRSDTLAEIEEAA